MGRIFHVRINLDAVSADLNTLVDDKERGEWLRGFMAGASGGANRFPDESPCYLGWLHGSSARRHAEGFHERQSAKGKLSAESRKSNREGTEPQPRFNHGSTEPQPNLNLSNNPIIHNPMREESSAQDTTQEVFNLIVEHDRKLSERIASQPIAYSWQDWRIEHPAIAVGRTGEDGDPKAWRDLWTHYDGRECFDAMYAALTRNLPEGRKVWYGQAAEWLNKNTQDV